MGHISFDNSRTGVTIDIFHIEIIGGNFMISYKRLRPKIWCLWSFTKFLLYCVYIDFGQEFHLGQPLIRLIFNYYKDGGQNERWKGKYRKLES